MIEEVTGIKKIRMLYLQLLYRCNFTCLHCFHGKRLQYADAFTVDEAADLLTLMRDQYGTEAVTLLGGESPSSTGTSRRSSAMPRRNWACASRSAPTGTGSSAV
ncbi:hypothetical protein ACIRFF_24495 [Streptomyces cyaneofuscatus]